MRRTQLLSIALSIALSVCLAPARSAAPTQPATISVHTATGHPMQYLLSLPTGWTTSTSWPVVLVEESADKNFRDSMQRYVQARGDLPFILVMPYSVVLGSSGVRDPKVYPYSPAEWDRIEADGICRFEMDGVEAMLRDVRQQWHSQDKFFVTGLEAGAHLVWALAFRMPDRLMAAAPVAGNFRRRCVDDRDISQHPARTALPIMAFIGAKDGDWLDDKVHRQFSDAQQLAQKFGFRPVQETIVPGRGHEPLADTVFGFFATQLRLTAP